MFPQSGNLPWDISTGTSVGTSSGNDASASSCAGSFANVFLLTSAQIAKIANELYPSVIQWLANFDCPEGWGAKTKRIHIRKRIFVFLTRFAEPGMRHRCQLWKVDMEVAKSVAENVTAAKMNKEKKRKLTAGCASFIQREKKKKEYRKSPRQDILVAIAFTWVKAFFPDAYQKLIWYPQHALQVAYLLFLSDRGTFETFYKYLQKPERKKQPIIKYLLENTPESARTMGLWSRTRSLCANPCETKPKPKKHPRQHPACSQSQLQLPELFFSVEVNSHCCCVIMIKRLQLK